MTSYVRLHMIRLWLSRLVSEPSHPTTARQPQSVLIVRRNMSRAYYDFLQIYAKTNGIAIVVDRRHEDRRHRPGPVLSDRRRRDRRSHTPATWEQGDFVAVPTTWERR